MTKRRAGAGRKRRSRKGAGFVDTVKSGLSKANKFLRDTKIISKGAKALGGVLPPQYGSVVSGIGSAADALGYGRHGGARHRKLKF